MLIKGVDYDELDGVIRDPYKYITLRSVSVTVKINAWLDAVERNDSRGWCAFHGNTVECRSGFKWDGASGPTLDTPDSMEASLVHDIGCHLVNESAIPWKYRRRFDAEFRRILKRDGMPFWRRWSWWVAVRGHGVMKWWGQEG